MAISRRSPRHIVRDEVLDDRIAELMSRVAAVMDFDEAALSIRRTPDFSDILREQLKAHFEDEIIPAVPRSADGGYIEETELQHELVKKALVGLKVSRLREAGEAVGAQLAGAKTAEEVADRVASALGWDSEAVARFVLEHEEEPTDSAAHVSRLYSFADGLSDIDEISSVIEKIVGRYIRVGVARWYVFEAVKRVLDSVRMSGKYMSYSADVDPSKSHASLMAVSKVQDVDVTVVPSEYLAEVGKSSAAAAKSAVFATSALLNQAVLDYVPHAGSGSQVTAGEVHGSARFLLSILHDRLPGLGAESINPTVARFRLDHEAVAESSDSPSLRAIHFEGNHIFDSVPACQFLIVAGRPLANISFRMKIRTSDASNADNMGDFPVKIALASDHVQITTGLGNDPVGSRMAHQTVKNAVWAEVKDGHPVESSLSELIERIRERANSAEDSERATIFDRDTY